MMTLPCRRCGDRPRTEWRRAKPVEIIGQGPGFVFIHRCGYRIAVAEATIIVATA